MITLAMPCDGKDSSKRWFESHQAFVLSTLLRIASERYVLLLEYEAVN